jgi:hypothetical protein
MHNSFDELISSNQNCCSSSKIALENGKRFEIQAEESFTKINIDACLINSQIIEKCDFGFIKHSNNDFYFVELKGSKIDKALSQILATINYFEQNIIHIPKDKRFGFIVSSKVPSGGTDVNKLKQIFAKNHGKVLEIKNKYLIYKPQPSQK